MRPGALVLPCLFALVGCGPSPAMEPSSPTYVRRPVQVEPRHVVVACQCDDEDGDDDAPRSRPSPVEYVRIDEWEAPPAVKAIESRIEPRGNKPPEYVNLPRLTMHRGISPTTSYRRGPYWP